MPGKWGLTGTPTPNSLLELFAQVRLIDGGERLGRTFTGYRDRYFEAVDYNRHTWAPKEFAKTKILDNLADICLTLRTEDWLGVPETDEDDLEITLPKDVLPIYKELEKDLITLLQSGKEISAVNAAVLVNKLLQVTSGAVYDEEGDWHLVHDLKTEAAAKFVAKADGPVLVACSFRHEQERLAKKIPRSVRIDSVKGDKALFKLMADWQAGKVKAVISHPASIGHGIDGFQQGGKHVLWTSLPWSRGLYDQLNSRIVRMGQEHRTTITRILAQGTADFVVAEALRSKSEEQSAFLEALSLLRNKA